MLSRSGAGTDFLFACFPVTIIKSIANGKQRGEKISKTNRAKYASGERLPADGAGWNHIENGYIKTKKGSGKVYYRGTWEKFFIQLIDSSKIVDHFEWHPCRIPYKLDGEKRTYFPDCLVTLKDGSKWLVEIKGQKDEKYAAKCKAARRYCGS